MKRLSTEAVRVTTVRMGTALCAAALFATVWTATPPRSFADKTNLVSIAADKQKKDPTLVLTVGMADIVDVSGPVSDIMVANPDIVDVVVLQANKLYLVGSRAGSTNVIAIDSAGNAIKRLNVRVEVDDSGVRDALGTLFPGEDIKLASVGGQLVLSGHVSNPEMSNRVSSVVSRLSGRPLDGIVNMLTVAGEQQVMLRVKVVEASRAVLRELGVTTRMNEEEPGGILDNVSGALGAFSSGQGLSTDPLGIASVLYNNSGKLGPIQMLIRALEQDGLLNTLAEPNLTAVSGQEAGFLAGGEFPIPASRDQDGNIVVDYRPFGVALNFRPVVLSEDRISLQLRTEVSSISNQNSLSINQLSIPGFSVRRAQTTVELGSGGSLMIAGLLRSDAARTMTDLPGIKDVPVLGKLISSDSFRRDESELVVIVTAYLVSPYGDKTQASTAPTTQISPLATAFENNIRRIYARRPLEDGLFAPDTRFGYLLD